MPTIEKRERRVGLRLSATVSGRDESGAGFTETTHTRNLSGGGVCFETCESLPIGTRIRLAIDIPPALRRHFSGKAVYRVEAIVCRVEREEPETLTRVGARFLREVPA